MNVLTARFFQLFIFIAVALTGLCSLVYQTIWQRYLSFAVGSDASASVLILTVFLSALSMGYWLAGNWSEKATQRELYWYGWVECFIGLWAVSFPLLFNLGLELLAISWLPVFGVDLLLTLLLIAPPAVLMGVTLPYLTQGLSTGFKVASRTHARVYAINTFGALAGVLLAGFLLIERWGLDMTSYVLGSLNILLGLLVIYGSRFAHPPKERKQGTIRKSTQTAQVYNNGFDVRQSFILVVAACSGFLLIALETYFIRLFSVITEGSHHAYPIVVGAFVAAVGLGAWLAGKWLSKAGKLFALIPWWMLGFWLIIYFSLPLWPYVDLQLKQWVMDQTDNHDWLMFARFWLFFLVIALPALASSMLLPWSFHFCKDRRTSLGKTTGNLYAIATLATVIGGLIGGHFLFKWLNFWQIFLCFLVLMVLMLVAAKLAMMDTPKTAIKAMLMCMPVMLLVWIYPPVKLEKRLALGFYFQTKEAALQGIGVAEAHEWLWRWFGHERILATAIQPEGRVDVFENSLNQQRMIAINGRSNSDTAMADLKGNGLLGLFPYLLTESPRRVLIIGLGTGVTAGFLAQQSDVEQVDVCEINSAVLEQLPLFDDFTYQASENPKLKLIHSDVIKFLHQADQSYDLIISIPSNFWVAGVENLLTPDFYQLVKGHLNPGGAFVQWVPEYRFSEAGLTMIARAFVEQFEHTSLWKLTDNDLVFIHQQGISEPLNQPWLKSRSNQTPFRSSLRSINVYNVRSLLQSQLATHEQLLNVASYGDKHNLNHPQLGVVALEALFMQSFKYNSSDIVEKLREQKKHLIE